MPQSRVVSLLTLAGTVFLGILSAGAREILIADLTHLGDVSLARPGDVVILQDGDWPNAAIDLTHGGAPDQCVTLRAQTPGRVRLTGASSLVLAAPYLIVDGLLFQGGALSSASVIQFKSHDGTVRNCAIIAFNPPKVETAYNWVYFTGPSNRLERCFFEGKSNLHALVENGEPNARHNVVTRCYFKDIPLRAKVNGRETIKVLGAGHVNASTADGAYFLLESNLFVHADGEGAEVVSLKSNYNQVVNNTIIASVGCLNIRRGSYNEIRGNVILGQGVAKAEGIRMAGEHNLIEGNYIAGCDYGISVSSGEYWAEPLTSGYVVNDRVGSAENKATYPQNRFTTIRGNVAVGNSGPDLDMGTGEYKKHWPKNQNVLLPEACVVEQNRFYRPAGGASVVGATADHRPPLDRFVFQPNHYSNNLLFGGTCEFGVAADGCRSLSVPPGWSEAAERASFRPLTPHDVGPGWMLAPTLAAGP